MSCDGTKVFGLVVQLRQSSDTRPYPRSGHERTPVRVDVAHNPRPIDRVQQRRFRRPRVQSCHHLFNTVPASLDAASDGTDARSGCVWTKRRRGQTSRRRRRAWVTVEAGTADDARELLRERANVSAAKGTAPNAPAVSGSQVLVRRGYASLKALATDPGAGWTFRNASSVAAHRLYGAAYGFAAFIQPVQYVLLKVTTWRSSASVISTTSRRKMSVALPGQTDVRRVGRRRLHPVHLVDDRVVLRVHVLAVGPDVAVLLALRRRRELAVEVLQRAPRLAAAAAVDDDPHVGIARADHVEERDRYRDRRV